MLKPLSRPIVAVMGNSVLKDKKQHLVEVKTRYLNVIADLCDAQPIVLPPLDSEYYMGFQHLAQSIDGVFLTGNVSSIDPKLYGTQAENSDMVYDTDRDETVIPYVKYLVELGIPLLAVCRGMQEMNVAYGGSLHQNISDIEGNLYHRWYDDYLEEDNFVARHNLKVQRGGILEDVLSTRQIYFVNSLHEQGIDRLGRGLMVEGLAEDGVIEAISVQEAASFALGVQWHPEWPKCSSQLPNKQIFVAFSQAVFQHHEKRIQGYVG